MSEWEEITVMSPIDNNTNYRFFYSGNNVTISEPIPYSYTLNLVFDTSLNTNETLKFKAPKNFPYLYPYDPITVLISDYKDFAGYKYGVVEYFDLDNDHTIPNDCFYETELFVGNLTIVEFVNPDPLQDGSYYQENVPQECLQQTIAGHQTVSSDSQNNREMWKNIRGESVHIFHYSVEKLIERGYLTEK